MKLQSLFGYSIALVFLVGFTAGCDDTYMADRGETTDETAVETSDPDDAYIANKPITDEDGNAVAVDAEMNGEGNADSPEDENATSPEDDVTVQDITDTVRDFVKQEKEDYEAALKEEVAEIDRYLSETKEEQADRKELQDRIRSLRAELDDQLAALKEDTAEAWDDLKTQADKTMEELKETYQELKDMNEADIDSEGDSSSNNATEEPAPADGAIQPEN